MLRDLDMQDVPALHRLSMAVGWPHREPDVAMLLSLGGGLAACGPDGAIQGSALRWRWSADCATIGMVLVAPAQQGKGIGKRLMQALLAIEPMQSVMLNATEAGLALYERLGFRPLGMIRQHQGQLSSWSAKADHPRLRAATRADVPDLIALDQSAFGVSRAPLIETLTMQAAIQVLERHGKLRGFAARRRFGHGETMGPLVAETEDDAIALVAALLRAGFQRIDIPAQATALAAWLTRVGLMQVDSVTVMTRGEWPPATSGVRRFALAAQAFG